MPSTPITSLDKLYYQINGKYSIPDDTVARNKNYIKKRIFVFLGIICITATIGPYLLSLVFSEGTHIFSYAIVIVATIILIGYLKKLFLTGIEKHVIIERDNIEVLNEKKKRITQLSISKIKCIRLVDEEFPDDNVRIMEKALFGKSTLLPRNLPFMDGLLDYAKDNNIEIEIGLSSSGD